MKLYLGLYRHVPTGHVVHRTVFKIVVNPVLRWIQFFTNKPYVFASKFKNGRFVGYSFMRVEFVKDFDNSHGEYVKVENLKQRNGN